MDRHELLAVLFPKLRGTSYRITSPQHDRYNCIAWSAEDMTRWWWPLGDHPHLYWPPDLPTDVTLETFEAVFATLGYLACTSEEVEPGFEKVAIYVSPPGTPTHAVRQLPDGNWTSKLGKSEDIEHALRDLEGDVYGTVAVVLKRPRSGPTS